MYKIDAEDSILVVIDMQEKLLPSMANEEELIDKTAKLIKGCRMLGVPIIATQQYTRGLGSTAEPIKKALTEPIGDDIPANEFKFIEKISFSSMGEPNFREALRESGKSNVIICGVESHVCVQQTAMDIYYLDYDEEEDYDEDEDYAIGVGSDENGNVVVLEKRYVDDEDDDEEDFFEVYEDYSVFLVCVCIDSRDPRDKEIAIRRMESNDIELMTMESVLFELTDGADNPRFKQISKTVK